MSDIEDTIRVLEATIKALTPPFLALPEHGLTPEKLAYRRGARDAYIIALAEFKKLAADKKKPGAE